MAVKIIIVRRVPREKEEDLRPLLLKMRALANTCPGYISGETLINYDDPEERLVISSWRALENWQDWVEDPRRRELQSQVDALLGSETLYSIYYNG
ncbi:antibiotic biosynthesis monooxygenase family protein [Geoalkalibacter subterraneus]|jgi:heme-degrading monooxygenase HmoA|uniref:ABM domain-containing protein n=1 Tax=Geoalkalibacter subterraneus TaxID=483547 RepID=A0A0B5FS71_9BACT|nr:antibiotic biosynthesis monooxygenase [Geoalkalibacter subterraneus]AJF07504.1 hypothetical protein GSUB_14435 [Geoalkalibacter subterraneus]